MKVSKFRIAVLVLLVVICYIAFVCWSIIEYNTYVTNIIAEYEELGIPSGYIDPWGYIHFWYAKTAVITGIALIFGVCVVLSRREKDKSFTRTLLSIVLLASLVFTLISVWLLLLSS